MSATTAFSGNLIFHNPRCSKSRQTLALLQARDVHVEVVRYLENPPDSASLLELCRLLDREPLAICRTGEARFRELGLSKDDSRSAAEWAAIMAANPILIERPIVVIDGRAAMGRPPEAVLDLLPHSRNS